VQLFAESPLAGADLDFERDRDLGRDSTGADGTDLYQRVDTGRDSKGDSTAGRT
jgi:hypothetical protein